MHFNINHLFYSQNSHQHVSAGIAANIRVMFLLQEYSCGLIVFNCVTIDP